MSTSLSVESINHEYCMIRYSSFAIILCEKDQYVNMSTIIALNHEHNPKMLSEWIATNQEIIAIIAIIAEETTHSPIYYSIETGPNNLRGLYCHQLLIPYILSPKLAVRVNRIISLYYEHKANEKIKALETHYEDIMTGVPKSRCYYRHEWIEHLKTLVQPLQTQYTIEGFIVDAVSETEDEILLFEYDMREPSDDVSSYNLDRYKQTLRIFMWTKKRITWLRFNGESQWSRDDIRDVIECYREYLNGQANILYLNYGDLPRESELLPEYSCNGFDLV